MVEQAFSYRQQIALLALIILVAISGALLLQMRQPSAEIVIYPPAATATPPPSPSPGPMLVYVSGAVQQPATQHLLPPGARVSDAIAAAGGFADDADPASLNMAQLLRDGVQVHVSRRSATGKSAIATPFSIDIVNINSASQAELETLPGIGPITAASILAAREQFGRFAKTDDLLVVRGIGPVTLNNIREFITVD